MTSEQENTFDSAMSRYQAGEEALDLIKDFESITASTPNQSAPWFGSLLP